MFDQQIEGDSRKRFYAKFIGISESKLYRYRASYLFSGKGRIPEVLTDDEAVKNKIASDIAAIGYIDNAQVDETVKVVLVLDI